MQKAEHQPGHLTAAPCANPRAEYAIQRSSDIQALLLKPQWRYNYQAGCGPTCSGTAWRPSRLRFKVPTLAGSWAAQRV